MGKNIDLNDNLYLSELEKQIEKNNMDAMVSWAEFWFHKMPIEELDKDIKEKMIKYYQLGAKSNNQLACNNLGTLYHTGRGVKQDYKTSAKLYKMALEIGGDDSCCATAVTNLGYYYYYGLGETEINYEKAYHCYLQGSIQYNNSNAYYKLGDMYRYGKFVDKNNQLAFQLYKKAYFYADDTNDFKADICLRIGDCLINEVGCKKDIYEALHYFQESERYHYSKLMNGNPYAKRTLPILIELMDKTRKIIFNELKI